MGAKTIVGETVRLEPLENHLLEELCASLIPDADGWYPVMFGLTND